MDEQEHEQEHEPKVKPLILPDWMDNYEALPGVGIEIMRLYEKETGYELWRASVRITQPTEWGPGFPAPPYYSEVAQMLLNPHETLRDMVRELRQLHFIRFKTYIAPDIYSMPL